MASAFCFYLVGSKGNVSAFFWLQCVPSVSRAFQRRRFESFCGVLLSLSVVRSKGNVSRVFLATVSHGIGTKPAGVLLFPMCSAGCVTAFCPSTAAFSCL